GLANSLRCLAYRSRAAAIAELTAVDALLVTVGSAELKHVTTSKVFDCLASGKPLIGIVPPDGELAKLLRSENETCFSIDDVAGLSSRIRGLIKLRRAGDRPTLEPQALAARRDRHSWRAMAQAFAARLDRLT
ncbi:MAG TPA: hypothetical protein VLB27_06640, partial [candidate division Zixibacteria bacterium]|nr:hypothetical protein [candidate division Zixibacteria bacterium]